MPPPPAEQLGLVIVWSRDEPGRVGEILPVPTSGGPYSVGREGGDGVRLGFERQRPGGAIATGELQSPRVSRNQLELETTGPGRAQVTNRGTAELAIDGVPCRVGQLWAGRLVEVDRRLLLWCVCRPASVAASVAPTDHPFGGPDADALVGESPAAWELRARIRFLAGRSAHTLVTGPSGAGKELVAAALHRHSDRAGHPLVCRNAATIPESLADAELFGCAANYPNAGMPARAGLVGEADGGTLFLDELGEMPVTVQAHLLRVLDGGEFQRLGESRSRRARLRVIAATNRAPEELRSDLLARFPLRLGVPGLAERREDIPLLVNHLLRRMGEEDGEVATRCFPGGDLSAPPQLAPGLVRVLFTRSWSAHVRELEAFLWDAVAADAGVPAATRRLDVAPVSSSGPAPEPEPPDLSADVIRAALAEHGGNRTQAARALGLSSRFQLLRLLKKHGIGGS